LKADIDGEQRRNNNGKTPLHLAVRQAHYASHNSQLAQAYLNTLSNCDSDSCLSSLAPPIHLGSGTPGVSNSLLNASPNDARHADENGHLPLHLPCLVPFERNARTKKRILQLLIGVYPEALKMPDDDGNTPLHLAARQAHHAAIKVILNAYYPKDAKPRHNDGATPLILAVGSALENPGTRIERNQLYD
jgi:ankyrin repeat protein